MKNPDKKTKLHKLQLKKNETMEEKQKIKTVRAKSFASIYTILGNLGYCFLLFLLQYSTHVLDRGLFWPLVHIFFVSYIV